METEILHQSIDEDYSTAINGLVCFTNSSLIETSPNAPDLVPTDSTLTPAKAVGITGSNLTSEDPLLLHGFSNSRELVLTLDLRHYDTGGNSLSTEDAATRHSFIEEARRELDSPHHVDLARIIRNSRSPVLNFSRRVDDSRYSNTNPNGLCGMVLTAQLRLRASCFAGHRDRVTRPLDLFDPQVRNILLTGLRDLAPATGDWSYPDVINGVEEWMTTAYGESTRGREPYLSQESGLWFRAAWMAALADKCKFTFFSTVNDYRGPAACHLYGSETALQLWGTECSNRPQQCGGIKY